MNKWIVCIVILLHSGNMCLSGGGCSTLSLCTYETTVIPITARTAREHGVLSAQRKQHPANRSQLNMAALQIVRQATASDIHTPGLSKKQKEKRAKTVRLAAEKQIKKIQEQELKKQRRLQAANAADVHERLSIEKEMRQKDVRRTEQRKKARKAGSHGYPRFPHLRQATSMSLPAKIQVTSVVPIPSPKPELQVEEA